MKKIMFAEIIIFFMLTNSISAQVIPPFFSPYKQSEMSASLRQRLDDYFYCYNDADYKVIYRDMSLGRFRSSRSFADFTEKINEVSDLFGNAVEWASGMVISDGYDVKFGVTDEARDMIFRRIELKAEHENGELFYRIVFMREKGQWMIDGLAIASEGKIFIAQGNLYGFPASKAQGFIWEKFDFVEEWKDSRKTGDDSFKVKRFLPLEKKQ